jgi:hypothetical protein
MSKVFNTEGKSLITLTPSEMRTVSDAAFVLKQEVRDFLHLSLIHI